MNMKYCRVRLYINRILRMCRPKWKRITYTVLYCWKWFAVGTKLIRLSVDWVSAHGSHSHSRSLRWNSIHTESSIERLFKLPEHNDISTLVFGIRAANTCFLFFIGKNNGRYCARILSRAKRGSYCFSVFFFWGIHETRNWIGNESETASKNRRNRYKL